MLDKLLNWASDLMSSQEDEQQQWMCGMNFSYLLVIYILEYFFFFCPFEMFLFSFPCFFFVLFLERCFVSVHRADTVLRCTATLSSVSGLITFISQSLSKCWNRLQERDVGNDPSYILHTSLQKKKIKPKDLSCYRRSLFLNAVELFSGNVCFVLPEMKQTSHVNHIMQFYPLCIDQTTWFPAVF